MNIRYFKLVALISISVLIASCSSVKVQKPSENYSPVKFSPKPSVLSFNVKTDIKALQNDLNKELTGLIMEDNSLENNGGDNVMFKAWKQDNIILDIDGNTLSYKVPLKTWIKAGFSVTKFGITLQDYREFNASLAIKLKTAITLNPDWSITTKTTSDGYEWLTTPTVKIAGIDFSVKFVADIIMQAGLKKIGGLIDENIKEDLNFRPYAAEAWNYLQQPLKINDQYNIWLKVIPDKIISSKLTADKGIINHHAAATGSIMLSVGEMDMTKDSAGIIKPKPLPDILIGKIPDESSKIYSYITIPFTEINKTANDFLKGKKFDQGRRSVTIEDIRIYGSEGNLVAETKLSGSFNGTIFFKGLPVYRSADSSITINNFDYDLSTKNFLIKSASWLYQDGFRKMIAKELNWSIAEELKMVRSIVNTNLKNYNIVDGINISGNVDKLLPGNLVLMPEGIIPEVVISGKLGLSIEGVRLK